MSKMQMFTGGYTEPIQMGSGEIVPGRCPGITCYAFDEESGKLEKKSVTAGVVNPSYLITEAEGPYLYCVNERKEYGGIDGSTVSAYRILNGTGELEFLNSQFTCGADACHLALSRDGRYLLGVNFSGSSVWVMPVREDHSLAPASCILRHQGSGLDPERQEAAHPHQIVFGPVGNLVYIPDLGLDRLLCYELDERRGWLLPRETGDICGIPGQGIRHAVFDCRGEKLYVITEMTCEINVYFYNKETGEASLVQRISAMPAGREIRQDSRPDWTSAPLGAGIRLHPSGKWLYAAVRRSNHMAVFAVESDGSLRQIQTISCGGEIPREFVLSPDGRFLLAANQDSDNICEFAVDPESGILEQKNVFDEIPCVTVLSFRSGE